MLSCFLFQNKEPLRQLVWVVTAKEPLFSTETYVAKWHLSTIETVLLPSRDSWWQNMTRFLHFRQCPRRNRYMKRLEKRLLHLLGQSTVLHTKTKGWLKKPCLLLSRMYWTNTISCSSLNHLFSYIFYYFCSTEPLQCVAAWKSLILYLLSQLTYIWDKGKNFSKTTSRGIM